MATMTDPSPELIEAMRQAIHDVGPIRYEGWYSDRCAQVAQDALDTQAAEIAELRRLLTDAVVAAGRMTDRWAESDDAVRLTLWRNLHTAAEAAHGEVYPLASERDAATDADR